MLLVAQTNLLTFPIVLPNGHCPSIEHHQQAPASHHPPHNQTGCWLHFDAKGNLRVPRMCQLGFCSPVALSPSECMHWSISISHGAFNANPADMLIRQPGKEIHRSGKPVTIIIWQQLNWTLNLIVQFYMPDIQYYIFHKESQMSLHHFLNGWCSLEELNPIGLAVSVCLLSCALSHANTYPGIWVWSHISPITKTSIWILFQPACSPCCLACAYLPNSRITLQLIVLNLFPVF